MCFRQADGLQAVNRLHHLEALELKIVPYYLTHAWLVVNEQNAALRRGSGCRFLRKCCSHRYVSSCRGLVSGPAVRRLFHQLCTHAIENFIENFNGQFKSIFDVTGPVPTKGLVATQHHVLGAVLVYQLALLYRFRTGGSLRAGLKPLLQVA